MLFISFASSFVVAKLLGYA